MPKRILVFSKKQPARTIIMVVCGLTLLAGIFMFTPFYGPVEATPLFGGPVSFVGIVATAILNLLAAIPGLYGAWKNNRRWMWRGSFNMFLWYLFVALSRLILFPYPGRLLWLPALMLALVMGVLYLEQKSLLSVKVAMGVHDDRAGEDE